MSKPYLVECARHASESEHGRVGGSLVLGVRRVGGVDGDHLDEVGAGVYNEKCQNPIPQSRGRFAYPVPPKHQGGKQQSP